MSVRATAPVLTLLSAARTMIIAMTSEYMTVWPSGLRRWLQAPVRKGVGPNPTAVTRGIRELVESLNVNVFMT